MTKTAVPDAHRPGFASLESDEGVVITEVCEQHWKERK